MKGKREAAAGRSREKAKAKETDPGSDVIPWLRGLGVRVDDARRAAELCADIPDAPLEERVRRALSFRRRPGVTVIPACGAGNGA